LKIYRTFDDAVLNDDSLIEIGLYCKQLKRYFKFFPRENILTLFYEDLIKNPVELMQKIYKFLHLKDIYFIPNNTMRRANVTGNITFKYKIPLINDILYRIKKYIKKDSSLIRKNF